MITERSFSDHDLSTLALSLSRDDYHPKTTTEALLQPGTVCNLYADDDGPICFVVASKTLRLDLINVSNDDTERNEKALLEGVSRIADRARQSGFKEIIVHTASERLAEFCVANFGFTTAQGELKKIPLAMKIYTKLVLDIETGKIVEEESYEYSGPMALCCGADPTQTQIEGAQQGFMNQIMNQAGAVFGNSSSVFNDLINTLTPTVAAGPNQEGFSAAENANLQSQAITNAGVAYRNAKSAVADAQDAYGGGNTGLTGGSNVAADERLASSAAESTASQLGQIAEANYATGRQNYDTALSGLEQAPSVFNTTGEIDNAATNSGNAASSTANEIAQENNSWVQGVTGALGNIAGMAAGGYTKNLGSK